MYIKDNYGCQIQKDYEVTELGTRDPYFFISKANSLIFAKVENTTICGPYPNDSNQLSYQSKAEIVYCAETLLQTCDNTKIQFKSNYENQTATLREDGEVDVDLPITKLSSNLNRFEAMDCKVYNYGNNQTGIYFIAGDVYDEAWIDIGDYTLNGNLPDFAVVGNTIQFQSNGESYDIVNVLYDKRATVRAKVIVIDKFYDGAQYDDAVRCLYNILPYEVYEFDIDWSVQGAGTYDVVINNQDTVLGTIDYISENVYIETEHKRTLAINYYNTNNRDIFYKYGQENFIRVKFLKIEGLTKDTSDINLTDDKSYLVDSDVYEADKFIFQQMTKNQMRQLTIALSCEYVFINDIGYIKDGNVDSKIVGETNLYDVTCDMVKTSINYNTRKTGSSGVPGDYVSFNIPALIGFGDGFIKQ
jgi:hypothetical protein